MLSSLAGGYQSLEGLYIFIFRVEIKQNGNVQCSYRKTAKWDGEKMNNEAGK
jgi:hypothetical protein